MSKAQLQPEGEIDAAAAAADNLRFRAENKKRRV
jgi:hypothetical protein